MANSIHSKQTIAQGIHGIAAFSYANQAARLAAGPFLSSDLYKVAVQLNDNSLWVLTSISPITWQANGSQSLAQVLDQGNTTDGYNIIFTDDSAISIAADSDNFNISYAASTSGNGRDVVVTAQSSNAGNGNGGNIILTPGAKNGSGTVGKVNIVGNVEATSAKITGVLDMNTHKITNLATPTVTSDATTKAYVDALVVGTHQSLKQTLSYGNSTDGYNIVLANGDLITSAVGANLVLISPSGQNINLLADSTLSLKGATVRLQGLTDGYVHVDSTLDVTTHRIVNVTNPISAQDAATKNYVDNKIPTLAQVLSTGSTTGGNNITISSGDAITASGNDVNITTANTSGVAGKAINLFGSSVSGSGAFAAGDITLNAGNATNTSGNGGNVWLAPGTSTGGAAGFVIATQQLSMSSKKIINLATPTLATDAVTKAYVDGYVGPAETLAQTLAVGNVTGGNNIVVSSTDKITSVTTLTLESKTGTGAVAGSQVFLNAGGAVTSANAGDVNITGGSAVNGRGGHVFIASGSTFGSGAGGNVYLTANTGGGGNGHIDVTGNLTMNSYYIQNVLDPVSPQDAATKNYVDGYGAITATSHKTLRQSIHFLSDGPGDGFATTPYKETLPSSNPFPTSVIWWETSSKLKKIFSKDFTYTGSNPTTIVYKTYLSDGVTVAPSQTVTDTITYSGPFELSRTRAFS